MSLQVRIIQTKNIGIKQTGVKVLVLYSAIPATLSWPVNVAWQ